MQVRIRSFLFLDSEPMFILVHIFFGSHHSVQVRVHRIVYSTHDLMIFDLASEIITHCIFWITPCSYYGFGDGTINQLLNWGPITFVPTVPFVAWILQRKDGVKV